MNTVIKAICTDFDGTIFSEFEHQPIPDRLVDRIRESQSAGVRWIINTGRDLSSLMEALGRSRIPIHPDYLVTVEREIHIRSESTYLGHDEWNRACTRDHDRLFRAFRPEVPRLTSWITEHFAATIYEDDFSPFCLIAESRVDADRIHAYLEEFAVQIPSLTVVRNDVYMRFSHDAYNKGTALSEIARLLGIASSDIFAAGDHFNDLPMLDRGRAAWLAAPSNAIPIVRKTVGEQSGYLSELPAGLGVAEALDRCLARAPR